MKVYLLIKDNLVVDFSFEEYDDYKLIECDDARILDFIEMNYTFSSESILDDLRENLENDYATSIQVNNLDSYDITHWTSNRSFGELIDMYINDEIIKPEMQRNFVWSPYQCSRLIESIILGLPIPSLFLMEVKKNSYEIIDGFQRLTTLTNFVKGLPWDFDWTKKNDIKRRASTLSKSISPSIAGKSFDKLLPEHKRAILRSTISLIQFKQTNPENNSSKYLIFERINTGSEKLTQMQIRKSLAYGTFIKELYEICENDEIKLLFSYNNLKKDYHIEAVLRAYVMFSDYYKVSKSFGISNTLNEFCEKYKNENIDLFFSSNFPIVLKQIISQFDIKNAFRRVSIEKEFRSSINMGIFEAFISAILKCLKDDAIILNYKDIKMRYIDAMSYLEQLDPEFRDDKVFEVKYLKNIQELVSGKVNPFRISTGSKPSIDLRLQIFKEIIRG